MAKKFTILEEQILDWSREYFELMPDMHKSAAGRSDQIGRAWNETLNAALDTLRSASRLGELLRSKAGITEGGPITQYFQPPPEIT